ncbi:epoxide hydrolase 2-like [Primulina eburnea]|uniref:epoxide hydrolase 2-like n=1 Tax=Primulina eburnea TaxID=1245227 RepID=UPI003C6C06AA
MEEIKHEHILVNGLKLHVAQIGSSSSPPVVFLHGFPEIWYSWRHQMIAVAKAGFRAVAFDYRGYGLSEPPPEPEKASFLDLLADLLALLDALVPYGYLPKVEVPALLIMGEKDYAFKYPGMGDYIKSGMVKTFVPELEIVYLPEGSHFIQEQSPEEVNYLIVNFLKCHV